MRRLNILRQPFPYRDDPGYMWRSVAGYGLFVFLFLWVFQPFGLAQPIPNKLFILLGYGLITSFCVWICNFILPFLMPGFFQEKNWWVWKEIVITLFCVGLIALLNLIYSNFLGFDFGLSWGGLWKFFGITMAMGTFPISASVVIQYYLLLNKHLNTASNFQAVSEKGSAAMTAASTRQVEIKNAEGEVNLQLDPDQILYLESAQNYVEVHHLNSRGQADRQLIRNTLKSMEEQLHPFPNLLRTHRSFIVNRRHIRDVSGNARGLQLQLDKVGTPIPVSRSYLKSFQSERKAQV